MEHLDIKGLKQCPIHFNGDNNLHIQHVEIFTGEDEYAETKCLRIGQDFTPSEVEPNTSEFAKDGYRLREQSVRIIMNGESTAHSVVLQITFHKGSLYLDAWETEIESQL